MISVSRNRSINKSKISHTLNISNEGSKITVEPLGPMPKMRPVIKTRPSKYFSFSNFGISSPYIKENNEGNDDDQEEEKPRDR